MFYALEVYFQNRRMSTLVEFNWDNFGSLRIPSASEDATVMALSKEMYSPIRPHLFLSRPVNSNSYFMFIVSRWRNNVERRHQTDQRFATVKSIGDKLFEWLMRLDKCVSIACVLEVDISLPRATLPNEVFERLRRVFRLLVFSTNYLHAEKGLLFLTIGQPEELHHRPTFYIKHRFDTKEQRQFMSRTLFSIKS